MLTTVLIIVGVLLLLASILSITDNLIQIEAKKSGIDTQKENMSLFPRVSDFGSAKAPSFAKENFHSLKKGHNIKLAGEASGGVTEVNVNRYAIQPTNFRGIAPIPKMVVEVGNEVKAGDVLFYDKGNPDIKYTAPVSGEVVEINRGEKRAISEVVILADKTQSHKSFDIPSLEGSNARQNVIDTLLSSGAWTLINARPFDTVADPAVAPRDIFVSGFDTAPLAPSMDVIVANRVNDFQAGINVLNALTEGKVILSLDGSKGSSPLASINNVEKHWFKGPHPAGNVGIQIHHINPIKLKDVVWTLGVQDVITIGALFSKGHLDMSRVVAITGSEVNNPSYVKTYVGANISELLNGQLSTEGLRVISGDVLSGKQKEMTQYLDLRDDQITVIPEGNDHELFGWLLPVTPRPSVSGTFPNFLFPNHKFTPTTNTHGEKRAFVMTGEYENMLPVNTYPQHLFKAIVTNDYERMEGLGIHELSEEDVALCEFACTSKQPLQSILREGLDMIRAQQ